MGSHARPPGERQDEGNRKGKCTSPPSPHRAPACSPARARPPPKMNPYSDDPNLAATSAELASFHATHLRSVHTPHSTASAPFRSVPLRFCRALFGRDCRERRTDDVCDEFKQQSVGQYWFVRSFSRSRSSIKFSWRDMIARSKIPPEEAPLSFSFPSGTACSQSF